MQQVGGQFLRFCLVGAVGFVVDAGTLELLVRLDLAGLYFGRVLSYLVAATVTWWLNARFTFRAAGDWHRYVAINAIGAVVTYVVYAAVLWAVPATKAVPSIAVAAGAAVALLVNFSTNRWLVFGSAPRA
jgi:putative flippase GtrA